MNQGDNLEMHRLSLRFPGQIEHEYTADQFERTVHLVRAGLLAAGLVIAVVLGLLALIDPSGDGYFRMPSARLMLDWSLAGVVLGAWLLTYASPSAGAVKLSTLVALAWFFAMIERDVATSAVVPSELTLMLVMMGVFFICTLSKLDVLYSVPFSIVAVLTVGLFALSKPHPAGVTQGMLFLVSGTGISLLAGYGIERQARREFMLRRQLAAERDKVERLLLNVLPEPIARRLEAGDGTIADRFEQCTVLFGDIVGFTEFAGQLPPEETVIFLNRVFTIFDSLADRHGLEKIKTIGDAYMAVGGVPTARDEHAAATVEMALDMLDAVAQFAREEGLDFNMRIGIASGPVVAGVIGRRRFAYDLWGDTVNTASRMETQGIPGSIQVTEHVYWQLRDRYEFQRRGEIEIKGKGPMTTYLLVRRLVGQGSLAST